MILDYSKQVTHKEQQKVRKEEHEGRVGQFLRLAKSLYFCHTAELAEQCIVLIFLNVASA